MPTDMATCQKMASKIRSGGTPVGDGVAMVVAAYRLAVEYSFSAFDVPPELSCAHAGACAPLAPRAPVIVYCSVCGEIKNTLLLKTMRKQKMKKKTKKNGSRAADSVSRCVLFADTGVSVCRGAPVNSRELVQKETLSKHMLTPECNTTPVVEVDATSQGIRVGPCIHLACMFCRRVLTLGAKNFMGDALLCDRCVQSIKPLYLCGPEHNGKDNAQTETPKPETCGVCFRKTRALQTTVVADSEFAQTWFAFVNIQICAVCERRFQTREHVYRP